jgi:L-threonylcarbamoyladenylate synthase
MIIKVNPQHPELSALKTASEVIRGGGIIIFPTDTIYGLGCNAFHGPALEAVFQLKTRPVHKPLPVLVNGSAQLNDLISGPLSPLAKKLIRKFWPGALTLILPASQQVPDMVTGGTHTIGVRMPDCTLILDLITLTQVPLIATSVNVSGCPASGKISKIITEWASKVDLILDGGDDESTSASTVLDLTVHPPKIMREEAIGSQQLQPYLGEIRGTY